LIPPDSIELHPHAIERLYERGTTAEELIETVRTGESYPVKFGRTGFRRNFTFDDLWNGRHYSVKQVNVIAAMDADHWIIITAIVKYF
jgi:hypothetical protein